MVFTGFKNLMLQQWDARTIRTTVMNPLQWVLYPLLVAFIASAAFQLGWVTVALFILFCLVLVVFLGSYLFSLGTNPELLRSEKYLTTKLAIQHGLGDSLHGDAKTISEFAPKTVESQRQVIANQGGDDHA